MKNVEVSDIWLNLVENETIFKKGFGFSLIHDLITLHHTLTHLFPYLYRFAHSYEVIWYREI